MVYDSARRYSDRQLHSLVDRLHDYIELYGYETIDLPVIEDANLFLTKAGDQIIGKLFTFERYGRELALRPEFTAAAAYRYAQQPQSHVVRWQFSGYVFEDVPDDSNQHNQRYSMGAELIGMSGPVADAEVLNLVIGSMELLNIHDWQLAIGHAGLSRQLVHAFGLDPRTERFLLQHTDDLRKQGLDYVLQQLDGWLFGNAAADLLERDHHTENSTQQVLDILLAATERGRAMGGRTRIDIAQRLLQKHRRATERPKVIAALQLLDEWVRINDPISDASSKIETLLTNANARARESWHAFVQTLNWLNLPERDKRIVIQPDLARDWDYYTGMVFELRSVDGLLLAGGGRYDELVRLINGEGRASAVGLALYLDPVMACVDPTPLQSRYPQITISTLTPDSLLRTWTHHLRDARIATIVLPESETTDVFINDDGLHYKDQLYTLSDIDNLIQDIKRHDR